MNRLRFDGGGGLLQMEALRSAVMDGRYEEAWSVYLRLKAEHKPDAEAHYLGGRAALGRSDVHGVKDAMQRAVADGAVGQTLGRTLLVLGEVQRRIGELNEAVETLERFLNEMEEYPELGSMWRGAGLHNLGLAYRQLGRLEDARQSYLQAADAFRRDGLTDMLGKTLWTLAWVLCLLGDTEGAREALAESEEARQDQHGRWHQLLGWAHVEALEGWCDSTSTMCRQIVNATDAPPDVRAHAHWLLGREALRLGDLQMALAMADAAIEAAEQDHEENRSLLDAASLRRAILLTMRGRAEGA